MCKAHDPPLHTHATSLISPSLAGAKTTASLAAQTAVALNWETVYGSS